MYSIEFKNQRLYYLAQTKLPLKEIWQECKTLSQGYQAIRKLDVRGAPLIGVFAAYCVHIGLKDFPGDNKDRFLTKFKQIIEYLAASRPTAVNLFWALERISRVVDINNLYYIIELITSEKPRL